MIDKYNWLRDKNWPNVTDKDILSYLQQENVHFNSVMQNSKDLQEEIYQELKSRIKEEDESYPVKKDNYYYYKKIKSGLDYPLLYRRLINSSEEELLLDVNFLAKDKSSFSLGTIKVSEDHSKLAYSYDEDGSERFKIIIKDLSSGLILHDKIDDTIGNIVWNSQSTGFYYIKLNENWRPDKLMFHLLGADAYSDILLYQENNPSCYLDISSSSSKKYLFLNSGNSNSNEIRLIALNSADNKLNLAIKKLDDMLYELDHLHDKFYIKTNDKGKNFRLVSSLESENFDSKNFQEIISHSPDFYIIDFALYINYIVIVKKILGLNIIEYYDIHNQNFLGKVPLNNEIYSADIEFTSADDQFLRIHYSSLISPKSVLEYNFADQKLYTRKIEEIGGGYNIDLYEQKRLWVDSTDGVKIPISMVYRKDKLSLANNLLLYGYGSYGYAIETNFRPNIISLLDRGFIYVIAHIRGGDELGFAWYENAKLLNKTKTFDDFIAVSEYLIRENYTNNLAIMGGSAGGMLMGAVVNQRPELFKTVVALVPFVDVLNTMLDESLPLTPLEYEEWGNPKDKIYYNYIKSYSPYDNIKKQNYPNMLVTAGLTDPRVGYWEAAKWVAKLREYKQDNNILLLKTEMDSGHKGQSGRFKALEEIAMIYSYLIISSN
jgi:oligopeptidase B